MQCLIKAFSEFSLPDIFLIQIFRIDHFPLYRSRARARIVCE